IYVGAGFQGFAWPDQPHFSTTVQTGYATFFDGSISDVAFYNQMLSRTTVAQLYASGHAAAQLLTDVTRPSGKTFAQVGYDGVTSRVSQVTDANGSTWQLNPPTVSGSSQVYVSSVLASRPVDYLRLADSSGSQPYNEVSRTVNAWYNLVTLGVTGPFADATAGSFDGASSYLSLDDNALVRGQGNESVGLWFK